MCVRRSRFLSAESLIMSRSRLARALVALALLIACASAASPRAAAKAPWTMDITARQVEPASLTSVGVTKYEELFVYVTVHYNGPALLYLNPGNFRLLAANDNLLSPVSYDGPEPLKGIEIVDDAYVSGWLLFLVPTGATNLSLVYKQTQSGKGLTTSLVFSPRFTPRASPRRDYGVSTQPALRAYLLDEALAAGYIQINVDPLDSGNGLVTIPASARGYLRQGRSALLRDHGAFDRIAAPGADAQRLKAAADAIFTAIEKDLAAGIALRQPADWQAWRATFAGHDRALANLYQTWPGLTWPEQLPVQ